MHTDDASAYSNPNDPAGIAFNEDGTNNVQLILHKLIDTYTLDDVHTNLTTLQNFQHRW